MHRAVLLKMEEEWVQKTCDQIAAFKPDVVITGVCACVCVWGGVGGIGSPVHCSCPSPHTATTACQQSSPFPHPAAVAPCRLLPCLPDAPAEKGLSDLAAHYLMKHDITAIRRLRKTDNNRIARACGATIVSRPGARAGGGGRGLCVVCRVAGAWFAVGNRLETPNTRRQ